MPDMLVNLLRLPPPRAALGELRRAGLLVRRAQPWELTPVREFVARHFKQGHPITGTGRALYFEVVAVEAVQVQEAANEQYIDGHPNRSTPVGVAAEHPGI